MRILIVTEHFWPEEFRINDVAFGLVQRGHRVEVLTAMPNYPVGRYFAGYRPWGPFTEGYRGVVIHRVPAYPRSAGRPWQLLLNYASFAAMAAGRLLLTKSRWDAVLVFQPTPVSTVLPALVVRSSRVPVIAWVQDLWPETLVSTGIVRSRTLLRAARAISRWLYRRCDRLLGQSPAYASLLGMGIPEDRCGVLPNWAAENLEQPPAQQGTEPRPWGDAFTVMFAGNLGRVQALDTVLDAAEMALAPYLVSGYSLVKAPSDPG